MADETKARKLAREAWDKWANEGQSTDPIKIIQAAIQSAEDDARAECDDLRKLVHQYRDLLATATADAEAILRPYLTTTAVFGITPDHNFKPMDQLPFKLAEAISSAIASAREKASRGIG